MTNINDGFNTKAFTRTYQNTIKSIQDNLIEKL